jgi:hypothetical protein
MVLSIYSFLGNFGKNTGGLLWGNHEQLLKTATISMMSHSCNPSTQESDADCKLKPGLHRGTLCQKKKKKKKAKCLWLRPVILTTWEAKIGRISVKSLAQANTSKDLISKLTRALALQM